LSHPLKQVIESMVVSDLYLDREEENLYWSAVARFNYDKAEAESLLEKTIVEYQATRELTVYQDLKIYLEGPLRDALLDFEEEKRCEQWLLLHPNIPIGAHSSLLYEACEELGAHIASQLIDELIATFKSKYNMPHWDDEQMKKAIEWATQRWVGLTKEQIFEIMDSLLD
jgi:hypothetical protein